MQFDMSYKKHRTQKKQKTSRELQYYAVIAGLMSTLVSLVQVFISINRG